MFYLTEHEIVLLHFLKMRLVLFNLSTFSFSLIKLFYFEIIMDPQEVAEYREFPYYSLSCFPW